MSNDKEITPEQHEKHRSFFEDEGFFKQFEQQHPDASTETSADEDFFKQFDIEEDTKSGDAGDPVFFMSREEVIEEVKKDGMFLQKVSGRYGNDIEIVSLAVENNAMAYSFASKTLQADDQVADVLKLEKQVKLQETQKQQGIDPAVLVALQDEIETINRIHNQAVAEKESEHLHYQHMSM